MSELPAATATASPLSSMVTASRGDRTLDDEEILSHVRAIFAAGASTTHHGLGNTLHALLTHPEQYAALEADPEGLMSTAVDEIQERVPASFGISRAELVGSSRAATPLRARQIAILLTREATDLSLPQIGRLYGGNDNRTWRHGLAF